MSMSPFAWYIALLAAGLLLIAAEIFLPGGAAGVIGGLALLAAMAVGLVAFPAPWGFISAISIVVFGGIVLLLWVQIFPRTRTGRRITLRSDGADFKSSAPPPPELVGAAGEALTALRPAGTALIAGKRYDVLADGGVWLAAGSALCVSAIRDGHVIVRDTAAAP